MGVHNTQYLFYITKKMHHITATIIKMRFFGSNYQVYYDSLHSRQSAYFQHRYFFSSKP